jgi:hypothetical protein
MTSFFRQSLRVLTACILVTTFAVPDSLLAQAHVVSPADLDQQLFAAGQTRQSNLDTVQRFLSSPTAEKAFASLRVDSGKVKTAISSLNDEELANLGRARE